MLLLSRNLPYEALYTHTGVVQSILVTDNLSVSSESLAWDFCSVCSQCFGLIDSVLVRFSCSLHLLIDFDEVRYSLCIVSCESSRFVVFFSWNMCSLIILTMLT